MSQNKEIVLFENMSRLEKEWDDTVHLCGINNIFSTYEWLKCWLQVYGNNFHQFIPCIRENGVIIAIAPLAIVPQIRNGITVNILKFMGDGSADYLDFIVPDDSDKCLRIFFDFIYDHHEKWDYCTLSPISEDSNNIKFLINLNYKR